MEKLIFNYEKTSGAGANNFVRLDEFLRKVLPAAIEKNHLRAPLVDRNPKSVNLSEAGGGQIAVSNSKIRRLILAGSVFVNGRVVTRPAFELRGKSVIAVEFESEKFFFEKQPDDIQFEVTDDSVLFEDENLIFVNKPAFFPVEQTITGNRANLHDAVVDYLWKKNPSLRNPPYVGIMHRLDRTTSGVILFTKTRAANKEIHEMFENHAFIKEYYAVVEKKAGNSGAAGIAKKNIGHSGAVEIVKNNVGNSGGAKFVPGATFTVENYLGRISGKSQQAKWGSVKQNAGGLYAKTDFIIEKECIVEGRECFLVKCLLYTGRTHQIRVHLSESGLPILGDELYGGKKAKRIYLHSYRLAKEGKFDVSSSPDFL